MDIEEIKNHLGILSTLQGELDVVAKIYEKSPVSFEELTDDQFNSFEKELKNTALMCAALKGDITNVMRFIQNGADVNAFHNTRPLIHALAWKGDVNMLRALSEVQIKPRGYVNFDMKDRMGMTALQILIDSPIGGNGGKHTPPKNLNEVSGVLIEKMVGVDHRAGDGYSALYYAVKNGYNAIAEKLIEKGAGLNGLYTEDQLPVLYWAFKNERKNKNQDILKANLINQTGLSLLGQLQAINAVRKKTKDTAERTAVVNLMTDIIWACPDDVNKIGALNLFRQEVDRPELTKALSARLDRAIPTLAEKAVSETHDLKPTTTVMVGGQPRPAIRAGAHNDRAGAHNEHPSADLTKKDAMRGGTDTLRKTDGMRGQPPAVKK